MATIPYTITALSPEAANRNLFLVTWANLGNGDVGQALDLGAYHERSAQVSGTFGAGGSVRLEGSLLGTTYAALHDSAGVALDQTAAGIATIRDLSRYTRPRVTAGDGTTALTVSVLAKLGR